MRIYLCSAVGKRVRGRDALGGQRAGFWRGPSALAGGLAGRGGLVFSFTQPAKPDFGRWGFGVMGVNVVFFPVS